ncbi:T9SS type A sorting domain-containing protein, partial [Flagellimonas sp. DF-77]|uniref:T9SS type A sorting domain-containing protein n=1 Tax=Flagellimonas algarum TaxID=3230298 RepID=UPI00339647EB
ELFNEGLGSNIVPDEFEVLTATSTQEPSVTSVKAFPNPTNKDVSIIWSKEDNIESIFIFDMAGRLVRHLPSDKMERDGNTVRTDLTGMEDGLYILILQGEKGSQDRLELVIRN